MDDARSTEIGDHSGPAGWMLRVFESFADEFSSRGIPVHLENVARDGHYLKGSRLGQRPERFVENYLLWPALDALDYEYWAQPHGYPKWEASRPDFEVQNFDAGLDCAVVGEVKTPNKFEHAADDIEEYLEEDLETPTVGIATDGVRWAIYVRPARDPDVERVVDVDLSTAFEYLPLRHTERETYSSHAVRREITDAERLVRSTVETRVAEILGD